MKNTHAISYFLVFAFCFLFLNMQAQTGVGITTPENTAALEIKSDKKGLLIPRMTLEQRDSISTPTTSLLIYQTDNTPSFYYYDSTKWVRIMNIYSTVKKIDDLDDGKSDSDGAEDGSSVYLGIDAGAADDSTDNRNVGLGFEALKTNTDTNNTAVGYQSSSLASGNYNAAFGFQSFMNGQNDFNTAVGYQTYK